MLYKKQFEAALIEALGDCGYYQIDDDFYIYKPEVEMVCMFTYDVFWGGRDFEILAGASSFSEGIETKPNSRCKRTEGARQLDVRCLGVRDYVRGTGVAQLDNVHYDDRGYPMKHTKATLLPKLEENIALLRSTLLADLQSINTFEDYYAHAVRRETPMFSAGYSIALLDPSPSAFFLCLRAGRIEEASAIYLAMLRNGSNELDTLNTCMQLESTEELFKTLRRPDYTCTLRESVKQWLAQIEIVAKLLEERRAPLEAELSRRIAQSRETCENFFAGHRLVCQAKGGQAK